MITDRDLPETLTKSFTKKSASIHSIILFGLIRIFSEKKNSHIQDSENIFFSGVFSEQGVA